jgi:hypothetical protein
MAFRISLGPVFIYESLILARRRQVYVGRALFVFAMLIGLTTAWYGAGGGSSPPVMTGGSRSTLQILALAGEKFFYAMAAIQLAMVLLVAPAATAGAFGYDRTREIFVQLAQNTIGLAERSSLMRDTNLGLGVQRSPGSYVRDDPGNGGQPTICELTADGPARDRVPDGRRLIVD